MPSGLTLGGMPLSATLESQLSRMRNNIQTGKKGYATAGVSLTGVEFGVASKIKDGVTVEGYAARLWATSGWEAGGRISLNW